jgi:PAS domain S-box-containing protein
VGASARSRRGRRPPPEQTLGSALVLDESGHITHASPSARAILGARLPDLLGRPLGDLAAPEDRLRLARWLTEHRMTTRAGRPDTSPVTFRVARRYGLQATAQARALPVSGLPDSTLVVVELNASPERPTEDVHQQLIALQERIDQLDRSNHELEALAYTAAHELRSPLASLTASAELLVRAVGADLDEPAQELVGAVLRTAGQMRNLVDALLRCSLAGSGLQIERQNGEELVSEAVASVRSEPDLAEAVVMAAPIGPVVADLEQLRSVFRNLLVNSARYRSPDRPLRIAISVEDGPVERTFTVADNGRGIPVPDRERVFAMFERLDTRGPGSGIGLATCQRIIEGHGGRIWLDDGMDGGISVRFTLPAQPSVDHGRSARADGQALTT